jgi:hypothetical protein
VVKRYPSVLRQVAVAKTEPGDENNQDISSLVGKVDIRKLETYAQDDPDAYSYSGGLCLANQGLLEFVEMFKAPIKVLHPLLTATQEGNFKGTEGFGAIPFEGIILAHSNESEWKSFRNNKNNEAFLDRIYIVKVPYCLRVSEEVKIYEKLIRNSSLASAPCAPGTLKMMAQFAVLTRLKEPENSSLFSKMQIYDGENLKDTDPKAKSLLEYRDVAGVDEGMSGVSTRFAYKILSKVFNFDSAEVAANPVHLMYVLEQQIEREQFPKEAEEKYLGLIKEQLSARYAEFIGKEIQTAYLESYSEYGQNLFDRYVIYADYWIQDSEYRDTDTGEVFDRAALNAELEKMEKPAGIANPKDFRNEIVNFVLRARAGNGGKNPAWTSYEKLRAVIEKKMFSNTEDLLPVISFNAKASADDARKHENFVQRMVDKGYTASRCACCASGTCGCARAPEGALAMLQSIIDRRLSGKNKSIGNRERFLRRVKEQVREAVRRAVDGRSIRDIERGENVRIPKKDLGQPVFQHGNGGVREVVRPGNREYLKGDRSPKPQGGSGGQGGGGEASDSGEGEDDFVFSLSREEFLAVFFEDLALPNLLRTELTEQPEWKTHRAGFVSSGSPTNLHVVRSMRGALSRRIALGLDKRRSLQALQAELIDAVEPRRSALLAETAELRRRLAAIPYLDPIDLRFRNRVRLPVPSTNAVMFCLMDVSG